MLYIILEFKNIANPTKKLYTGHMKQYKSILILFVITCITWYISTYHIQIALIQGASMSPTYSSFQPVLVDKTPDSLKNGTVILFRCESLDSYLIKRIVAGPGDEVFIKNNTLYVNGIESPNTTHTIAYAGSVQEAITLQSNEYFVLGDNHAVSVDSRYPEVGIVHQEDIAGSIIPQISVK